MPTLALLVLAALSAQAAIEADYCQAAAEQTNTNCPHSILNRFGLPDERCQSHVMRTLSVCTQQIDRAQAEMLKATDDKKYAQAADRYGRALITLGRLRTADHPDIDRMQGIINQAIEPRRKQLAASVPPSKRQAGPPKQETNLPKQEAAKPPEKTSPASQPTDGQPILNRIDTEAEASQAAEIGKQAARAAEEEHIAKQHETERIEAERTATQREEEAKKRSDESAERVNKNLEKQTENLKNMAGDDGGDGTGGGPNKQDGSKGGGGPASDGGFKPSGAMMGSLKSMAGGGAGRRNLANPQTKQDLMLASLGGFKAAFNSGGFKVGKGADGAPEIMGPGGLPATASELDALRGLIREEPRALEKRPDFYNVIPRESFKELKETYREKPDAKAFKHMGVPEWRDFEWNRSCDKVSGDCNPYTRQSSYRKNEFVSPEDLWNVATVLGGGAEGEGTSDAARLAREKLSGGKNKSLMKNVLGALSAVFGALRGGSSGSSSSGSPVSTGEAGRRFWDWGERQPVEMTDPALLKKNSSAVPGGQAAHSEPGRKSPTRGIWWMRLIAAGAAAGGGWLIWRRKSSAPPPETGQNETEG